MTGDAVYDTLLVSVFIVSPVTAALLLFIAAPYGRHDRGGWGPRIDTRLAWVVMESPAVLVFAAFFLTGPHPAGAAPLLLFAMWELHYLYRAFVYPFRLRVRAESGTPLVTALLGGAYCTVNGYLNGKFLSTYAPHLTTDWLAEPRFLVGAALFVAGTLVNRQSDGILRKLRRSDGTGYQIPRGGAFRWVSSPNYLGELLIWTGFAMAAWSLPAVSFLAFTAANLVPRALSHHRWYRRSFPDYPPDRKALLPFIL